MFQWLRRMIFPIIIIALGAFLALIVLQWGAQMADQNRYATATYAASINGQEVSWNQFQNEYERLREQQFDPAEEELTEEKVQQLQEGAWNQILQSYLLLQEADKYHLTVSDEEVYQFLRYTPPQYLQTIPQFQTDGQFDYQKYFSTMLDPQAASFWKSIEGRLVEDILKLKVQHMVIQAAMVTEDEVKQSFLDAKEKVRVGLVNVSIGLFDRPQNTDEELQQYYQDHQDDYRQDERAVLKMVKLDKEPSEADWERTYRRAKIIYDSIQAGADFEEMARTYGEDASSEKGGDLGWFAPDRMVKEFSDVAFTMKEGDLSEPFRTKFGWHIVKLHAYRTENDIREAHCSHILIRTTMSEETSDYIHTRFQDFLLLAEQEGFEPAAIESRLPIKELKPFTAKGPIEMMGHQKEALKFAFEAKVGDFSDILETNAFVFVVELAERLPSGVAPFEDVRNTVDQDVRSAKLKELSRDTAAVLYADLQETGSLKRAAEMHSLEYKETDPITRSSYIPGVGQNPPVLGAAFSLKEPGQYTAPVEHATGTALLQLLERTTPDLTEFNEKRDSVSSALLMSKQQQMYSTWFAKLVDDAEIENNIPGVE